MSTTNPDNDPHATLVDADTVALPKSTLQTSPRAADTIEDPATDETLAPLDASPTQVHPGVLARGMIPTDRFPRGGDTIELPPARSKETQSRAEVTPPTKSRPRAMRSGVWGFLVRFGSVLGVGYLAGQLLGEF